MLPFFTAESRQRISRNRVDGDSSRTRSGAGPLCALPGGRGTWDGRCPSGQAFFQLSRLSHFLLFLHVDRSPHARAASAGPAPCAQSQRNTGTVRWNRKREAGALAADRVGDAGGRVGRLVGACTMWHTASRRTMLNSGGPWADDAWRLRMRESGGRVLARLVGSVARLRGLRNRDPGLCSSGQLLQARRGEPRRVSPAGSREERRPFATSSAVQALFG